MGPQLAAADTVLAPASEPEAAAEDRAATGATAGSLADDAAHVGWPQTIRTLLQVVRPYRRQLAVTALTCCSSRVSCPG